MGLIGTRSVSKQIPGIHDIKAKNRERIVRGIEAVMRWKPCAQARRQGRRSFQAQGRPGLRPAAEKVRGDVRQATPGSSTRP
jgi:cytochrome d ubiquinol oxidase subunit I